MSGTSSYSAPIARATVVRYNEPRMVSMPKGAIRVRHREYMFTVDGNTSDFLLESFEPINPGNQTMFAWLSQIATRYESYTFNSLRFIFESLSPSTAKGVIMMAVDFEATDPQPQNKLALMAYQGAVRSNVWKECSMSATVQNLQKIKEKFTLDHTPPLGQDLRLYNVGNLVVATGSCADSSSIGEIYVEYDVTLKTPQIESGNEATILTFGPSASTVPSATLFSAASNYVQNPPDATESIFKFGRAAGLGDDQISILKKGAYIVNTMFQSGGGAATANPVTITSGDPFSNTVNPPSVLTGSSAGLQSVNGNNLTNVILNVTRTPAAFTINATSSNGAHINSGSTMRIVPQDITGYAY